MHQLSIDRGSRMKRACKGAQGNYQLEFSSSINALMLLETFRHMVDLAEASTLVNFRLVDLAAPCRTFDDKRHRFYEHRLAA